MRAPFSQWLTLSLELAIGTGKAVCMEALGLSETMHFVACSAKQKEKQTRSNFKHG